jgi:hypothetical protein
MTTRTHRGRVTRRVLISLLAAGIGCSAAAQQTPPGASPPAPAAKAQADRGARVSPAPAEQKSTGTSGGASGMTVYIDPKTGAFLSEPAPGTAPLQLTPQLRNALSTSHEGLVEVPSSVPGGGVKIDLQGRFQSPLTATTDAGGKVTMQHVDETPKAAGKK